MRETLLGNMANDGIGMVSSAWPRAPDPGGQNADFHAVAPTTGGGPERGQARPLWPRARPGSPSQPASRAGPACMRYSYIPPM